MTDEGLHQGQAARFFSLRAAMSLAPLWRHQRKIDAARDLLAPLHGWFTEGFDTLDLIDAKAFYSTSSAVVRICLGAKIPQLLRARSNWYSRRMGCSGLGAPALVIRLEVARSVRGSKDRSEMLSSR